MCHRMCASFIIIERVSGRLIKREREAEESYIQFRENSSNIDLSTFINLL